MVSSIHKLGLRRRRRGGAALGWMSGATVRDYDINSKIQARHEMRNRHGYKRYSDQCDSWHRTQCASSKWPTKNHAASTGRTRYRLRVGTRDFGL